MKNNEIRYNHTNSLPLGGILPNFSNSRNKTTPKNEKKSSHGKKFQKQRSQLELFLTFRY